MSVTEIETEMDMDIPALFLDKNSVLLTLRDLLL